MLNEIRDFSSRNEIWFYAFANEIEFIFFIFVMKLHVNYQMLGKINSNICLMLSVDKSFQINMTNKEIIYSKI